MKPRAKPQKLPIFIVLLFMLAVVLTILHGMPDEAGAPHAADENGSPPAQTGSPGSPGSPGPTDASEAPGATDPTRTPEVPGANGEVESDAPSYIDPDELRPIVVYPGPDETDEEEYEPLTLRMERSDIGKGNLMLINYDIVYQIPKTQDLVLINDYKTSTYEAADDAMELSISIMRPLNAMMDAFYEETGIRNVTIASAYRDYYRQQTILDDYAKRMGRAAALKWAALPGYSEHHSGLAVDLGLHIGDKKDATFTGEGSYAWFARNSYKYGFILRYPENKTDITRTVNETWHFRYVGELHAYLIKQKGWCLEEYIEYLGGFTPEATLKVEFGSEIYEIYHTTSMVITLPSGCDYEISGNNIDGFIVTFSQSFEKPANSSEPEMQ
ncbi:MAG: M15 family metallopeptidase [Oscillospiraceae bacterium]|nr:M15 family metallopeptidase [Oscillospiraceae bacterium]